jgi:hypothetical protein
MTADEARARLVPVLDRCAASLQSVNDALLDLRDIVEALDPTAREELARKMKETMEPVLRRLAAVFVALVT